MVRYAPVRIQNNGYIMLGRFCWHRESRLGRGWFGGPLLNPVLPELYTRKRDARRAMQGSEGAVVEFHDNNVVAVHMLPSRRAEQEKRLNYWRGCYGGYERKELR